MTTDHLRAITLDERLMAASQPFTRWGDVLAMGAAPQAALSQIVLPPPRPTSTPGCWPASSKAP